MANPDATTIPGEDFIDTLPPAPSMQPVLEPRAPSDAPDRLVFFFSGFDPKGATFYHRLFRSGMAQRNASHDETLAVGGRHRIGRWASVWTGLWRGAPAAQGGRPATMRTRVHFMRWDDIVRKHWRRKLLQLLRDYGNVYGKGLASGVLWRVRRQAPAAFGLALLPLGVLLVAVMAGLLVVGGSLMWSGLLAPAWAWLIGLLAGLVGWRVLAAWADCEWLLRLYAFMREEAVGQVPALDARLDEMAQHIVEAVEARIRQPGAGPLKEVMFVGYSTGTVMAAAVLARALHGLTELVDSRRTRSSGATLSMVTLGQCIPIAAEWPEARRLRADIDRLVDCKLLTWHDYSSSSDRAAFWRMPPWPEPGQMKSHQASPRFRARPSAVQYAAMQRERREMHLQYLRSPAGRGEQDTFDFFALTCGPATLAQRHSSLKPAIDLRASSWR